MSVLLVALGLAMDATAVCASRALAAKSLSLREVLRVALVFGSFHALMPWLGFTIGRWLGPIVEEWDHWIAFTLLTAIGVNMLRDAREQQTGAPELALEPRALFGLRELLALAFATSIDSLAVGVTLPLLGAPPVIAIITIALVAAIMSALGLWLGRKLGSAVGPRLSALGGVVLIAIAARILITHLRIL